MGFPDNSVVMNPPANAGDSGSILGREDPLEKGMATHSSIRVWRHPWTEEPGGLQHMGLKESNMIASNTFFSSDAWAPSGTW